MSKGRAARGGVLAGVMATAIASAGCYGSYDARPESRVWSTANSNDGYASCPTGTTVTGGGFEIKEQDRVQGRVPLVVASKPEANGWRVACTDASGAASMACRAWATCASVLAR